MNNDPETNLSLVGTRASSINRKHSVGKPLGVRPRNGGYCAFAHNPVTRKAKYLGQYPTMREAQLVVDEFYREHWGPDAITNASTGRLEKEAA